MNIHQLLSENRNQYLYEGLNTSEKQSVMLWESAGYLIKEAALTSDQIQQLFTSIEKSATDSGSNRTLVGQGKDVAVAVNKAWEDLKTKVQNSGPIQGIDAKYDQAAEKLKQATGGDQGVMKYVEKYRKFAKEHPIAQGLIYSALIAAAGISGAGVGGAAALGLLKMTDKLLQGEKFSSAAYSGAKTGALAYGASKVADLFKGGQPAPDAATAGVEKGLSQEQVDYLNQLGKDGATPLVKDNTLWVKQPDGSVEMLKPPKGVDPNSMLKIVNDANDSGVQTAANAVDNAQELTASQMSAVEKAIADGKKLSPQLQASYDLTNGDAGNRLGAAKSDWYGSSGDVASAAKPFGANMDPDYLQRVVDADGKSGVRFKINPEDAQKALDWQAQNAGQAGQAAQAATSAAADVATSAPYGANMSTDYLKRVINADGTMKIRFKISPEDAQKALAWKLKQGAAESIVRTSQPLSEGQVYLVFNRVCLVNNTMIAEGRLVEGPMDWVKGLAGKAMSKAKTFGHNLTTKVTADKLNSAWQSAGSPTDSEELKSFLIKQGVNTDTVDQVYQQLKITSGKTKDYTAELRRRFAKIKTDLTKLDKQGQQRIITYLQQQLEIA
jgi:hypothetical protein